MIAVAALAQRCFVHKPQPYVSWSILWRFNNLNDIKINCRKIVKTCFRTDREEWTFRAATLSSTRAHICRTDQILIYDASIKYIVCINRTRSAKTPKRIFYLRIFLCAFILIKKKRSGQSRLLFSIVFDSKISLFSWDSREMQIWFIPQCDIWNFYWNLWAQLFYFAFKSFACVCSKFMKACQKTKLNVQNTWFIQTNWNLRSRELGQTLNSSLLLIYNRLMECKF